EDGRIIVVQTGTFTLRTADTFDTGLYHCIGTNDNDADTLTFRITVVDPYVEHNRVNGAQLSAVVGSTLYLPCTATAVPDAAISWVLPEHVILHRSVRNKQVFDNGTLRIHGVTERDSGYFQCVAANQYGVDLLVFQVLVRKDETPLTEKHVAVGGWEEGDGSGNTVLATATTQKHPPAALATSTANQGSAASAPRNGVTQSTRKRNSHEKMTYRHYRDRISRRFRGHRRQFASSARRVDPQRWAAFLQKTKRISTLVEKRGEVATNAPVQVPKFSEVPGDEEETSGDLTSPEEEFMIPVTETATVSAAGRAMGSVVTAGPEVTARNTPARKTSLLVAEAVTSLPPPFSQPVSSDSRRPQTYLKPTVTTSGKRSDVSQISANGLKQSAVSNGASGTSTLFPAGQRLVYSGESNNQHLESVPTTPMTDVTDASKSLTSPNAVDKPHVFTESIDEISTKTGHQVPVVTINEPSPEFGPVYFHGTQKSVTPQPPLASTIIAHQQGQIIQDVTTHRAQAQQQYGRQRKISGRRRIVRPGRIPSTKEHRFDFERPGSVRGGTALAADVQMNVKYVSNLPTSNNLSSSINPLSPEAPLSSPSTMNMPLEHPGVTHRNTAFLREEENEPSARQKAATTVVLFITEGTHNPPQWKVGSSAPFQRSTDGVQPSSISLPRLAIPTAHTATETTHTISTKVSSTLESVSTTVKPRTSPKNSRRGKVTWERLSGKGAQKEVLKKLPNWTDMLPSTEVSTVPPKTTAAASTSKTSPLPFTPISTGGRHRGGVLSLNTPIRYGHSKAEEHLPTAKPRSHASPATSATTETDGTSLEPTVRPITTPQTDTKSKTFRVGGKRGQRRRRPSKTPTSPSVTAGHGAAAIPWVNTATVATVQSLSAPASLTPAEPLSESAGAVSETGTSAPWIRNTPEAPTAATWTSATPVTWTGNSQSATSPPDSRIAQSPTTATQIAPRLSKPFSPTGAQPATISARSGSEPAQQMKAITTAGEKSHPKMEERVIHENLVAQPTFSARTEPRTRAPAAAVDMAPPSARHPTPPP
ncbi:IGS10 protein, partial [Bucorvus abyssinicus]|nr:IGS10 protein [Bucorvus abyssinicus]